MQYDYIIKLIEKLGILTEKLDLPFTVATTAEFRAVASPLRAGSCAGLEITYGRHENRAIFTGNAIDIGRELLEREVLKLEEQLKNSKKGGSNGN